MSAGSAGDKRGDKRTPRKPSSSAGQASREGKRGHAPQGPAPRGRGRKSNDAIRREYKPGVRSAGAKVPERAARFVRAGHPWIFRETLLRPLTGYDAGALVPVADPDGNPLGYALYEPEGAVALRMISHAREFTWDEAEMLARVRTAKAHRQRWVEPAFAGACRLIHADADGFPGIAVDRYGEYLLVYKYARAAETTLDRLLPLLEQEFEPAGIYLQDRTRAVAAEDSSKRPPATHVSGKPAPPEFEVEEDGLRFLVDVSAPVSPGLFLDLREGRRLLERLSAGKRVLNLFSFTGALALRAVRGGAKEVTNIDAAARSHARTRQNLAASQLDPEACEALTGDVFKYLERFRQRGRTFDLVVVDPPPFSSVKGSTWSALSDWAALAEAIAHVVAPSGEVLAIANAAAVTEEEFLTSVGEGCTNAGRAARVIAETGLPPDFPVIAAFPEGKYLKIKLLSLLP